MHDTVVVPTGNVAPDAGLQVTTGDGSTTSTAVAAKGTTAEVAPVAAFTVMFAGTVSTGGVTSLTMTLNVFTAVLPVKSFAVHDTVVVPTGKVEPEAGAQVTNGEPSTASVAVAKKGTTAELAAAARLTVIVAGTVSAGGVVSRTVTVKVTGFATLPCASVMLQVTGVLPSGNVPPEAGRQAAVFAPSTASDVAGLV